MNDERDLLAALRAGRRAVAVEAALRRMDQPYELIDAPSDQALAAVQAVTVVSRFRPRRQRCYEAAPRMGEVVRRLDADPRLAAPWAERSPFEPGWDVLPG